MPVPEHIVQTERAQWYQPQWRERFGVDRSFSLHDLRFYKYIFSFGILLMMIALVVGVLAGVGVIPGHGKPGWLSYGGSSGTIGNETIGNDTVP